MTDLEQQWIDRTRETMIVDVGRGISTGKSAEQIVGMLFDIPEVAEALEMRAKGKQRPLLDHIAEMQHQMRRYLSHEIDADAFISEIIERLDGPKWREIKG